MFSPKDSGLQLPLQGKLYHGRRVICDAVGNELFILEFIRPSIEAKQMLDEWMEAICEKFNGGQVQIGVDAIIPESDPNPDEVRRMVGELVQPQELVPVQAIKRKRG